MRNKYFVILSIILFLFCIALYPILIDRIAIPKRMIDRSYQQFLLKASKPIKNKIIVSGGSSSLHSIDANQLENHFKRHTFVLADNAGYPLEHRIYNFSNYISSGDLIIFPLEWTYFAESKHPPGNYVSSTLDQRGSLSYYYRELPLYKKLNFIFNDIPFSLALKRILHPNRFWRFNFRLLQNELISVSYMHNSLNSGLKGDDLTNEPPDIPRKYSNTKTCDEYLFINNEMDDNLKISEQFKANLVLLQNITRETGAEVIFTWPAVVGKTGNECYTSKEFKDKIDAHAEGIAAEVNKHGFKFIGNIYDSRFDSSCFLNTYYHLTADCAKERTRRLIGHMEKNGITPATSYSREENQKILNDYLTMIELPFLEKLTPPPLNVPIETGDLKKNLLFSNGWSALFSNWNALWSNGKTSTIIIPRLDTTFNSIRFKGDYFNGIEKTGVWINDYFAGRYELTNQTINVAGKLNNDSYNRIVLEHSKPVAPFDLGLSNYKGKIKYTLQSIEFIN